MSQTIQKEKESNKSIAQDPKSFYSLCREDSNQFFNDVEKSVTQYRQLMEDLQKECVRSCRKFFDLTISTQEESAKKTGTMLTIPEAAQKIANDVLESYNKVYVIQSQTMTSIINTVTHNIKAFNDNAKSFAELNNNIIQLWAFNWFQQKK